MRRSERREVIGGGDVVGKKSLVWGVRECRKRRDRGEKMGLGEKNGEEFDQVKVALVPVFKTHVPDEFVLGGHVVVSDHAAVPPRAELHPDVSSY